MTVLGCDVSQFQPNWQPGSAYKFVFVRVGFGMSVIDPKHTQHVSRARKAKMLVGHYWFLRPGSIQAQAERFVTQAKAKAGELLACDWETYSGSIPSNAEKDQFIKAVKKLAPKNKVLLYCNSSTWKGIDRTGYCGDGLWIADYSSKPGITDPWVIWQYSDANGLDKDHAQFDSIAAMKKWAKVSTAVKNANAAGETTVVKTLGGTVVDVPKIGTGTRLKFRDRLTNTTGGYPGCACHCIPQWVALVEALAKEQGIPVPLQFWQGSWSNASASAGTHSAGGALDIKITGLTAAQVTKLVKICRQAGSASWHRDKAHGNFDTPHIHAELIGCSHASSGAKNQWSAYKKGRDGLAANGPDYGPKVKYITAAKAFTKLTRTEQDWLTMATEKDVEKAVQSALSKYLGDVIPSPSLSEASVKKNPKWTLASILYWNTKLLSFIRRDMPTKAQINDLIKAVKEGK